MPSNKPLSESHKIMDASDRKTEQYSSLKNLKSTEDSQKNATAVHTNSTHSSPVKQPPVIKSNSISDCSRLKTQSPSAANDHVCVVTFNNDNIDDDIDERADYKDRFNHVDSHPIIKVNDEDIDTLSDKISSGYAQTERENTIKSSDRNMPATVIDKHENIESEYAAAASATLNDETENAMKKRNANMTIKHRLNLDSENNNNINNNKSSKKSKHQKDFDKHYVNLANNSLDVNISKMSSLESSNRNNNNNIYSAAAGANRNSLNVNEAKFFLCDNNNNNNKYDKHSSAIEKPKLFHPPPITLTFERSESSSSLCETTILDPLMRESNIKKANETVKMNSATNEVPSEVPSNTSENPEDELAEIKENHSYLKSYIVSMLQPSDNKLAMKLFGSKKGVLKEKLRQQKVSNWVIHPCSNFR